MSEKKELNQEELEKVTGGRGNGSNDPGYDGFSGYLNMYSLSVGSKYYFTKKDWGKLYWCYAAVLETKEDQDEMFPGISYRKHKVKIENPGNCKNTNVGDEWIIRGDEYAVYTNKVS